MNETQRRQRGLSSRAKTPRVERPIPQFEPERLDGIPRLIQTESTVGLPSDYSQTEADAFLAARRASGEVASLPLSAAIPGTGPEGNKVGQEDTPNLDGDEGGDLDGDEGGDLDGDPTPITDKMRSAKQLAETYGEETAEDKAMAIWAKSNPTLAAKVKPGQSGYAAIQKALGKTPEAAPKEVEALVADSGYTAEEAKNRLEGGATEVVFEKGKEPVATVVDPQAFLSNAIGNLGNLNPFAAAVTSTTPTSTLAPPPDAQFTGLNIDAIGSYMTPENENMYKNLFPGAGGLNLRTGAR